MSTKHKIATVLTCVYFSIGFNYKNAFAQKKTLSIEMIQDRYKGKRPASATYVLETIKTQYNKSENLKQYVTELFPGKHRIDNGDIENGNALIYKNDSLFRFRQYKLTDAFPDNHYPTEYILGDIYFDQPELAKSIMRANRLDPEKSCAGIWEGRKVLILGTDNAQDRTSVQLWYDAQGLYPIRFFDFINGRIRETRYEIKNYGEYWYPKTIKQFVSSKQTEVTALSQVSFNRPLDSAIFDIEKFGAVHWVTQ